MVSVCSALICSVFFLLIAMSAYGEILTAFHQLPIKSQRAVAAVVGSMVADAATRPTHWLYDAEKMLKTIGSSNPEFWPENLSPFYTRELGKRSCYSDICFSSLQGLVTADSSEQGYRGPIVSALLNTFSPTSEYAEALERRKIAYDPSQRLTRNDPIPGPWQQKAVTTFLENHAAGLAITGSTDINESDGICCSIPVIARY